MGKQTRPTQIVCNLSKQFWCWCVDQVWPSFLFCLSSNLVEESSYLPCVQGTTYPSRLAQNCHQESGCSTSRNGVKPSWSCFFSIYLRSVKLHLNSFTDLLQVWTGKSCNRFSWWSLRRLLDRRLTTSLVISWYTSSIIKLTSCVVDQSTRRGKGHCLQSMERRYLVTLTLI